METHAELLDIANQKTVHLLNERKRKSIPHLLKTISGKEGALQMMEKGKALIHDRIKLITFADQEGWPAALLYKGSNIADTEAEAKKMAKAKKEHERQSEKRGGKEVR